MAKKAASPKPAAPRPVAKAKPTSAPAEVQSPATPLAPLPPEPVPPPPPPPPPPPIVAPAAAEAVPAAIPDAFPKWLYHASGDRTIVASQAAQDALGPEWAETPPPALKNGSPQ
jgi:FHA domain-containing protein